MTLGTTIGSELQTSVGKQNKSNAGNDTSKMNKTNMSRGQSYIDLSTSMRKPLSLVLESSMNSNESK